MGTGVPWFNSAAAGGLYARETFPPPTEPDRPAFSTAMRTSLRSGASQSRSKSSSTSPPPAPSGSPRHVLRIPELLGSAASGSRVSHRSPPQSQPRRRASTSPVPSRTSWWQPPAAASVPANDLDDVDTVSSLSIPLPSQLWMLGANDGRFGGC
jgi:hypothetical protein